MFAMNKASPLLIVKPLKNFIWIYWQCRDIPESLIAHFDVCNQSVALGWVHSPQAKCPSQPLPICTSMSSTTLHCRLACVKKGKYEGGEAALWFGAEMDKDNFFTRARFEPK